MSNFYLKLKDSFFCFLIYISLILIGSICFILLHHTFVFKNIIVFFYRGLILLLISTIITWAFGFIISKYLSKIWFTFKDAFLAAVVFCSFTLSWYTVIPVTVERSISVYMLSYMDQANRPVSLSEFENIFFDNYIIKYGAFKKRFNEQLQSKNMIKENNKYKITNAGKNIVNLFRFSAFIFGTEEWLVYPINKEN